LFSTKKNKRFFLECNNNIHRFAHPAFCSLKTKLNRTGAFCCNSTTLCQLRHASKSALVTARLLPLFCYWVSTNLLCIMLSVFDLWTVTSVSTTVHSTQTPQE